VNSIRIFFLALLLSACQSESTESEESKKPESATSKTTIQTESSVKPTENKNSAELPYEIVESDETCGEPVVIEFFAYQCPHCYTLEKFAKEWRDKNAGRIKFKAVPTHLGNQQFGPFLIVHQAAEVLGLLDKATPMLFHRLHEEKKAFTSEDEAAEFLVSVGATKEDALKALQDQENAKNAIDDNFRLLAKYKVAGVPAIVVNHRYKFDVTKAGGYEKVFEVVDQTLALPSSCSAK